MERRTDRSKNWLVTYSDFITLLLVFFVIFYSMTDGIEDTKLKAILTQFDGGEGVMEESSVIPASDIIKQYAKRSKRWESLNEYVKNKNLQDQVQIDLMAEGNRIILKESLTFRSGQAQLLDKSKDLLKEITYLFDDNIALVEVQGHTDNRPIRNAAAGTNWHLGARRAISVLQYLMANTNLPPEKFKASTLSQFRPLASNQSEEGRRANRRVEILIHYDNGNSQSENSFDDPVQSILNN